MHNFTSYFYEKLLKLYYAIHCFGAYILDAFQWWVKNSLLKIKSMRMLMMLK